MLARRAKSARSCERASALVEVALVLPLLLVLAFGVVGVSRVVQARMGVSAVVREAARSGALAQEPGEAVARGLSVGHAVAEGYGLTNGSLALGVDAGGFGPGGSVRASAGYTISLGDLPLLSWASVNVASEHVERVDLYRSRWTSGGRP
ncbi:MAG: TadE/TadG family type IV pilus assembly protein [Anaerolineae bacterium]